MSLPVKYFYEFGPFRIDTAERVLFRDGHPVPLPLKTFDTLVALVEKSGHIVEKDELMETIWPDTFVEEGNLARQVSNLRKALGEGNEDLHYIETVPRRGYRFVAQVRTVPIEISGDDELVVETHSLSRIVSEEIEALGQVSYEPGRAQLNSLNEVTVAPDYLLNGVKRRKRAVITAISALVVVLGAGLSYWLSRERAQQMPAMKSIPFTSYQGLESGPAFSPDGGRVAFVWNGEREDNFDIYVQLINAGSPLRLTSNPSRDTAPAWSPDGSHIAFVRISESGRSIFHIPAMGGSERKLFSIDSNGESWLAAHLSWSPDGKFIAFSGKESLESPAGILLLQIDNLVPRPLLSPPTGYSDTAPAYSPDGKILAFIRGYGSSNRDIYLVSAEGGEPRRLTFDNRWVDNVDWTSDGREIIFSSDRNSAHSLWKISASGGAPERVTVGGENARDATLSRQRNRLAYVQFQSDLNIWRWDLGGPATNRSTQSRPPTKLIASTRMDTNPQYSPDSNKVVFTSDRSGNQEIWVCDGDGSNLIRLTYFNGPFLGSPRWSHDGRQIAFDCTAQGARDIYVVSIEGGSPRRITTEASEEVRPSWSRDGKWIYFGSNRSGDWQVWKTPVGGGQSVQITRRGGTEAFESPDAKYLYYSIGGDNPGVWRVGTEGGEEIQIIDQAYQGNWALLDQGIYHLTHSVNRSATVEFYNFATGRIVQVGDIEKILTSSGPGFSVSRDGRWILCSRLDQSGSDIVLVENFR